MYIIENLPRAGTVILYRFGNGKWHKAIIDSGIVMTHCGIHKILPSVHRPSNLPKANPNVDEFSTTMYFDHRNQNGMFCGRCRR